MEMIQRGKNDKYPEKIKTWKISEKVPSWLSDRAQVNFVDGNGNIYLEMNNLSNGGRDIIKSGKQGTLVRLNSQEHYVCYSCGYPIFSLSPKQLELLYTENETE